MNEDQLRAQFGAMLDSAFAHGEAVYKPLFEERMIVAEKQAGELAAYELIFRSIAEKVPVEGIRSALSVLDITLESVPMTLTENQREGFQGQVEILRSGLLARLGENGLDRA